MKKKKKRNRRTFDFLSLCFPIEKFVIDLNRQREKTAEKRPFMKLSNETFSVEKQFQSLSKKEERNESPSSYTLHAVYIISIHPGFRCIYTWEND